jgi:hypothetical protein
MPGPGMVSYASIEVRPDGRVLAEDRTYSDDMNSSTPHSYNLGQLSPAEVQNLKDLGAQVKKGTLMYEQSGICEDAPSYSYSVFNGTDLLDIKKEIGCVPHILVDSAERQAGDQILSILEPLLKLYWDKSAGN